MKGIAVKARAPAEYELGETTCVCETCLARVPARIVASDAQVWYEKTCPVHGFHRSIISTDPAYFIECRSRRAESLGPPRIHAGYSDPRAQQGLRPTAMAILEIVDGCNAKCPTCSAASQPEITRVMKLLEIEAALDAFMNTSQQHDLLMISGGEPTLHPQVLEVLALAHARGIARVMLITNGFRIAREPEFASALAALGPWLEIYLQFDSLSEQVLKVLRGEDLRDVRARALQELERHQIATTLVCVVKKGLNETEIGSVVDTALTYKCVRGVTFQPMRAVGRTDGFEPRTQWLTLADIRTALISSDHFAPAGLQPHPCNPEMICIGYLSRTSGACVTDEVLELTACENVTRPGAELVNGAMFFSPAFEVPGLMYEDVFRVCVVSYMDRFDYTTDGAARSCIHFLTANGSLIPLETYYLFPSDPSPECVEDRTPIQVVRSPR